MPITVNITPTMATTEAEAPVAIVGLCDRNAGQSLEKKTETFTHGGIFHKFTVRQDLVARLQVII